MRHILETKAVLLSLTRELIVPVSYVEGAVKVPNNAFVGPQLKIDAILELPYNDPLFAFLQVDTEHTIDMH